MNQTDGSLARKLDFDDLQGRVEHSRLRLARSSPVAGPGKYKVLDARRRHAQIRARRLLDLLDAQESGR